jgi:ferredoxin-NADP reductase/predicted pyridoxine 5'-phosphate oxidase superfamily flavin-nucleotide-binding protein
MPNRTLDHTNRHQSPSPFHKGEVAVQEKLGVRGIEQWARKVVRNHFPPQHQEFYSAMPFLVVAGRDAEDRPWATILEGEDGFISSPTNTTLRLSTTLAKGDALAAAFIDNAEMGVLGIELATRRRNRVNGKISDASDDGFTFNVSQSFGNCQQYITPREWHRVEDAAPAPAQTSNSLDAEQTSQLANADTFFIASGYKGLPDAPTTGLDASHRGGTPGFVQIIDGQKIRFPDYSGNNHFNTLGNLVLDQRVGLTFVDFENGGLLQLSGTAVIEWDTPDIALFPGALRLITINIEKVVEVPSALKTRWVTNADKGTPLKLINKTMESDDVVSLEFAPMSDQPLPDFKAGQHLPITLNIPGINQSISRSYSLSGTPNGETYRISVKREDKGLVSRYFHDGLHVGDTITASAPSGEFHASNDKTPLVLIAGGIGVTPLIGILEDTARHQPGRPIWFFHGVRNGDQHPFGKSVVELATHNDKINRFFAYSQPNQWDSQTKPFDIQGRLSVQTVLDQLPATNAEFMTCGPSGFVADMVAGLEQAGVDPVNIKHETF